MPRPANPFVRDRLRSAGGDLIHRTSFGTTGVQDITAAAGVPKGSFYNYFASKDAFSAEILDEYWQMIEDSLGSILLDETLPPIEAVQLFFAGLIAYHAGRKFVPGCLIGNLALELASTSDIARTKLQQLLSQWTSQLARRLGEARNARTLSPDAEAREAAAALVDAFEGAVMRAKVERTADALQRFQDFTLLKLIG